jgi:hypothetical protein
MHLLFNRKTKLYLPLIFLVVFSLTARLTLAYFQGIEFDEAYYFQYAKYPDICHFDHPPIIGFLISLTTLNLIYCSEIFVRLGSIILGTCLIFIVFSLGKKIKNFRTGLAAAYLVTANGYINVMCSVGAYPDSPFMFFSLFSFSYYLNFIFLPPNKARNKDIFFAFSFLGLAVYSKYYALFLGLGIFLYLLFFNRVWFKSIKLYFASLIPLLFLIIIFYWQYKHGYIGIIYHGNRAIPGNNFVNFITSLIEGIVTTNPISFVLLIFAFFLYYKKQFIKLKYFYLIILCSFPLFFILCYSSLINNYGVMQHWWGYPFIFLSFISSAYYAQKFKSFRFLAIVTFFVIIGLLYVKLGLVRYTPYISDNQYLINKLTFRDRATGTALKELPGIYTDFINNHPAYKDFPIINFTYFEAAMLDYYLNRFRKNEIQVLTFGAPIQTHKYYWITKFKTKKLMDFRNGLFITTDHLINGKDLYLNSFALKYFTKVDLIERIPIYRNGKLLEYCLFYKFSGRNLYNWQNPY